MVVLLLVQPGGALGWRASLLPSSATALALAGGGRALPGAVGLSLISPAHLWGALGERVEFGYLRMFGDLTGFDLRWHGAWRRRPVQLVLRSLAEDNLELRDEVPTADPIAFFSARLMSATLMHGWQLGSTHLGLGLTAAYQRIFEYSARGLWLSAGWQGEPLPWLRWGLSIRYLGLGEALTTGGVPERLLAAGAGVAVKTPLWGSYLSADMAWDEQGGMVPTVAWQGAGPVLNLAVSIRWEGESPHLATGFTWGYGRWHVAYAYAYQSRVLGQPNMITVGRRL